MRISLADAKKRFGDRPRPVPLEFAGQWVAWNEDRTQIIAHSREFGVARAEAIRAGCQDPLMQ